MNRSAPTPGTHASIASPVAAPANYGRLASNTVATMAGRLAAVGLALVVSSVLFRTLGPEGFGLWSLFAFLVGYSALVDFGLSAAVERQVARLLAAGAIPEIPGIVRQALMLVAAAAVGLQVLTFAGTVIAAWWGQALASEAQQGMRVLPLSLALMTGSLVVGAGLSGMQRMVALHAWRTTGMAIGSAAVSVAAVLGVRRLDALLLLYASGAPLVAIGQWWSLRRELRLAMPTVPPEHAAVPRAGFGELLRFGGVLQVATIGPMLGDYAFRLIVGQRFGLEYAGIYDLAVRAALGLRSLASSLFVAMIPFGVSLVSGEDRGQATRLVRLAVKFTALLMLPSAVLLVAVADPLMTIWLGAGTGSALVAATFKPLVVLHALISLTVPMAMLGRSAGMPGPEAASTWGGATMGIVLALLVARFDAAVVAYAALPLASGLLLWVWLGRRIRIDFDGWRDLGAAALVAAGVGLAASGARLVAERTGLAPLLVVGCATAAGAVVGLPASAALGLLGLREWRMFSGLARRDSDPRSRG